MALYLVNRLDDTLPLLLQAGDTVVLLDAGLLNDAQRLRTSWPMPVACYVMASPGSDDIPGITVDTLITLTETHQPVVNW